MKKDYCTDLRRLDTFFEFSRDKWKSRSHNYQAEKRASQTQVRDLKRSVSSNGLIKSNGYLLFNNVLIKSLKS